MQQHSYQSQQLAPLLESFHAQRATGVLHINAHLSYEQIRTRVIVFTQGEMTYGGTKAPSIEEFARQLGQKFNPKLIKVALDVAKQKVETSNSARSLLDELVRIRTFTWEQVIAFIRTRILLALEQTLPYPGAYQFEDNVEFDFRYHEACPPLEFSQLLTDAAVRQETWAKLAPTIPSMDAVPRLAQSLTKIPDAKVRQHLEHYVDRKRSLVDIGEQIGKDPLQIAHSYLKWIEKGWITFADSQHEVTSESQSAKILSVDDSPIVQTTIKRALGDRYDILLADNAVDALKLLNQNEISVLLLDVTLPDIDGLEMCRNLRKIPKFRHLPIIMLTARDGFGDRLKGKIAGTNHYLTKPFDREKLIALIEKYL